MKNALEAIKQSTERQLMIMGMSGFVLGPDEKTTEIDWENQLFHVNLNQMEKFFTENGEWDLGITCSDVQQLLRLKEMYFQRNEEEPRFYFEEYEEELDPGITEYRWFLDLDASVHSNTKEITDETFFRQVIKMGHDPLIHKTKERMGMKESQALSLEEREALKRKVYMEIDELYEEKREELQIVLDEKIRTILKQAEKEIFSLNETQWP